MGIIKKLVTTVCGAFNQETHECDREKTDFGFSETINWIKTSWTHPDCKWDQEYDEEYSVIMPDGNRLKLMYGPYRNLVINMLNNSWECEGIFDNDKKLEAEDLISHRRWIRFVWYECNDWTEYDTWKYSYQIYSGEYEPLYFAENELKYIPDLDSVQEEEYYEREDGGHYILQEGPCPYDYPEQEEV